MMEQQTVLMINQLKNMMMGQLLALVIVQL
jgi:hypothetical protein